VLRRQQPGYLLDVIVTANDAVTGDGAAVARLATGRAMRLSAVR